MSETETLTHSTGAARRTYAARCISCRSVVAGPAEFPFGVEEGSYVYCAPCDVFSRSRCYAMDTSLEDMRSEVLP